MLRWVRMAVEVLAWSGACIGIWLISLSAVPAVQLYLAAAVSAACGLAALGNRLLSGGGWALRLRWLKPLWWLPLAIVTDSAQVLASALPGLRCKARFETVDIASGSGEGPCPDGRRALAVWLTCATPASMVAALDQSTGRALVHVLPTRGPQMSRSAARAG
ncbi:MAG: hypothetical protein ACRDZX_10885 [Acidimicrobiales bacterium]